MNPNEQFLFDEWAATAACKRCQATGWLPNKQAWKPDLPCGACRPMARLGRMHIDKMQRRGLLKVLPDGSLTWPTHNGKVVV